MVIAFDIKSIEIERGGHASDAVIRLKHHGLMPVQSKLIRDGKPHWPRAQDCNSLAHDIQNSRTTLLYTCLLYTSDAADE